MAYSLDITGDVCPMTWINTRLELEELEPGDLLAVRVRAGESHYNVKTNAVAEGHEIVSDECAGENEAVRLLTIRCRNSAD